MTCLSFPAENTCCSDGSNARQKMFERCCETSGTAGVGPPDRVRATSHTSTRRSSPPVGGGGGGGEVRGPRPTPVPAGHHRLSGEGRRRGGQRATSHTSTRRSGDTACRGRGGGGEVRGPRPTPVPAGRGTPSVGGGEEGTQYQSHH